MDGLTGLFQYVNLIVLLRLNNDIMVCFIWVWPCKLPSAHIICLPTLFTFVYPAQLLAQTLPSCIHKGLLVHCTTCHSRLSHHLVNGKLFQEEDMFAHKHGPRAPVFTVVMAALGYSTNKPNMFPSHMQKWMFVLVSGIITVLFFFFYIQY